MHSNAETPEKDINDVFSDLLFSEELVAKEGYDEGFSKGVSEGNTEAYHLGYHRGAEIGAELGYYLGVVQYLLSENATERINKYLKQLESLKELIDKFPKENIEDVDILAALDNVRAAYRRVCALLKIDAKYPEADNLSF